MDEFFAMCDPDRENLCLYGEPEGSWKVDLPEEEVPPELPEPVLGINFARDGMQRQDWIALIAVHSDAWLTAVAFYYGAKLDRDGRAKLFRQINALPTLYEVVTGKAGKAGGGAAAGGAGGAGGKAGGGKKRKAADAADAPAAELKARASSEPLGTGRKLVEKDVNANLKGRQAELFWPDDNLWYLVEILAVNHRSKKATIQYTTGETEELELGEIIRDGHMSLITK